MSEKKLVLKGVPASIGEVVGVVRIVHETFNHADFVEGDILVTKITDPTMVILMGRASAIICDIGSIVSHPSIVSREMGIPCVVNTIHATALLKDGQRVHVDGTKGEIYVIE